MADEDKTSTPPLTLDEDEIVAGPEAGLGRRGFLLGAIGGTTALAGCVTTTETVVVRPARTGITDRDSGRFADPAGNGRGTTVRRVSGITDSDVGRGADPAGNGRGVARRSCTDSDGGAYADPAGRGRRC